MTKLPFEVRNTVFLEEEPKGILKKLGRKTIYLETGPEISHLFGVRRIDINRLSDTVTFTVDGDPRKVYGIPDVPVPLTNQVLENMLTRSRLVYICG